MKYYIKIITGFREDQFVSIPMQEAQKAYYLFNHPDERGVFDCGVAIIGRNIQEIKPDFNATMGWKPNHELDQDDWAEIIGSGVKDKMNILIEKAKDVAKLSESKIDLIKIPLVEAIKQLPESTQNFLEGSQSLVDKFKI